MEAPFYNGAMPNLLDIFDKFIHADWFNTLLGVVIICGRSLIPLIMQLTEWAQQNMKNVMTHRRRYESAKM